MLARRLNTLLFLSAIRQQSIAVRAFGTKKAATATAATPAPAAPETTQKAADASRINTKFPMRLPPQISGTRGVYVNALWSAARRKGMTDAVTQDLKHLRNLLTRSSKISGALSNTQVSASQLITAFKLKDSPYNKLTQAFLQEVIEAKRASRLLYFINGYLELAAFHNKESFATIISAAPLSEADASKVAALLPKLIEPDRKLSIKFLYDPELISGLVVQIDGMRLDLSLASRLPKYEELVLQSGRKAFQPVRERDPKLQLVAEYVKNFKLRMAEQQKQQQKH